MIAQQVAADAGRAYVDGRALLLDPVDLHGIPWRDGADRTRWAPPAFPPPSDDTGRWLINLEELPSAVPMVQAALYQLVVDEREALMWGFVNMLHSQMQRLDRAVDRIAPEMRDLERAQDGTEVKAWELQTLTDRAQNLRDRRDAFEKMRDLAADAYGGAFGHGSSASDRTSWPTALAAGACAAPQPSGQASASGPPDAARDGACETARAVIAAARAPPIHSRTEEGSRSISLNAPFISA